MPAMKCRRDGKPGWKWGQNGYCFIGPGAKEKAEAVGRAIHSKRDQK